jgi:diadenosine tetraphosphate (Ap4A) HIT family hydrolase
MVRYKRVFPRQRRVRVRKMFCLMPQINPQFYHPSTKAKANLKKQLKAEGFDSVRFDEKESGRIFVLAWHIDLKAMPQFSPSSQPVEIN